MGVIDSLSAGYRFLGRRLELLLLPVLLDLLLWLAPRLSINPLFIQVADFYGRAASMEGMPPDMAQMAGQAATLLGEIGRNSNLLDLLVSSSLLHVPSLLVALGPLPGARVVEVDNPWAAAGYAGILGLLGLLIGVIYINLLARRLPLGSTPKWLSPPELFKVALRQWGRVVAYVLVVAVGLGTAAIPMLMGTAILTLLSPALGSLVMLLFSGMIMVLFFYLYFVTVGLVMDNLPLHVAIMRSFLLVRRNFWATLGFVFLTNLITLGFALIMSRIATYPPLGTVAAIGINAYIGSGLTMALLVFYRTRVLHTLEGNQANGGLGEL